MSVILPAIGELYTPEGGEPQRVFAVVPVDDVYRVLFEGGDFVDIDGEPDPGPTPEALLARAKALADGQIAQRREVAIGAGITVPGLGLIQTDPESLRNIGIKVRAALKAQVNEVEYSTPFRLEDNTEVEITGPQLLGLDDLIDASGTAVYAVSWAKKAQVATATTVAEVDAVLAQLNDGWP